ncbi:CopD family protein [Sulfitobacter mediterraneus]|jgi:protoporphyrinogen IX oxidase|uniref:CopD family protein n=1 Tax=Sulfitobacter TaxID=60136 RepID=UPI00193352DA|nr:MULTISPECIES: CopD family protein [Sulfitobacter]MBM1632943.1 CopD family protein [Sulfitobacter mediterraneus]MBM1640923.1 CopD family protein [Sulfitobacter mediterraneus]MBM1644808.1 CopD family protein [Sulfitobacter mediterraneus]MBM1649043.1 CopD family protein [Sulfitobacter mediterraneus]MBM1653064.1 CopD family protein [Sulfitobacter mediterraneus]
MSDLLALAYPWTKSFHIISVIAWMAALFYLPRLFVHHTEQAGLSGEKHDLFAMMEFKLANVIMRPAMHATWTFGLLLAFTPGIVDWSAVWPYSKAICVILMTLFHTWLVIRMKAFQRGENHITGRQFRMMNEVPTVLLIVIVISVVVKF